MEWRFRDSVGVRVWEWWSGFLLVTCCGWVVIFGSVCVEIFWRWAHWESGVGCVGSEGRHLTAGSLHWSRDDILQIDLAKPWSMRGTSHQPASMSNFLAISHLYLLSPPSR